MSSFIGFRGVYVAVTEEPVLDVFIKKAVEVKTILSSLFNIKVITVRDCLIFYHINVTLLFRENDEVGVGKVDEGPNPEPARKEHNVREFFCKLAGDDIELDWMELKEIMDYALQYEMRGQKFSKDVCRSMIAVMDKDHTGKLGFKEFRALWNIITYGRDVFRILDTGRTGYLRAFELRQALNTYLFNNYNLNNILSNNILKILMHRYGTKDDMITFDDFIMCVVRLKTMIDIQQTKDLHRMNKATFTLEEWLETTLYS